MVGWLIVDCLNLDSWIIDFWRFGRPYFRTDGALPSKSPSFPRRRESPELELTTEGSNSQ
jgi:hypothetical protein